MVHVAGDLDLFVGNSGMNEYWINGAAASSISYTASAAVGPTATSGTIQAAAFGDANGDGHLDLVLGRGMTSTPSVELWINDGSGAFSAKTGLSDSTMGVRTLVWGDVDADGGPYRGSNSRLASLPVANIVCDPSRGQISIYLSGTIL